jgi:hypothetical protein
MPSGGGHIIKARQEWKMQRHLDAPPIKTDYLNARISKANNTEAL